MNNKINIKKQSSPLSDSEIINVIQSAYISGSVHVKDNMICITAISPNLNSKISIEQTYSDHYEYIKEILDATLLSLKLISMNPTSMNSSSTNPLLKEYFKENTSNLKQIYQILNGLIRYLPDPIMSKFKGQLKNIFTRLAYPPFLSTEILKFLYINTYPYFEDKLTKNLNISIYDYSKPEDLFDYTSIVAKKAECLLKDMQNVNVTDIKQNAPIIMNNCLKKFLQITNLNDPDMTEEEREKLCNISKDIILLYKTALSSDETAFVGVPTRASLAGLETSLDNLKNLKIHPSILSALTKRSYITSEEINFIYENMTRSQNSIVQAIHDLPPYKIISLYLSGEINPNLFQDLKLKKKKEGTLTLDLTSDIYNNLISPDQLVNFIIKSSKELKIKYSSEYIDSLLNLSGSYLASNIPEKSIAYFNLIKQNLYPETKIIDIFSAQADYIAQHQDNIDKINLLKSSDILNYYTPEKIIKICQENYSETERFLEFYKKILTLNPDQITNIQQMFKTEISKMNNLSKDLPLVIKFFEHGIISSKEVSQLINRENEDTLVTLLEQGDITYSSIISLYSNNLISRDFMELITLDSNELKEKTLNGEISVKNLLTLFASELINEKIIKDLKEQNILNDDDLFSLLRNYSSLEFIKKLYQNNIIDYDFLVELESQGLITYEQKNTIFMNVNYQKTLQELKKRGVIENIATTPKMIKTKKNSHQSNAHDPIPYHLKMELLENIGCNEILAVKHGPLQGYSCQLNEKLGCAVLEKWFEVSGKESYGNATFVVPILKAVELLQSPEVQKQDLENAIENSKINTIRQNKKELRTDKHSKAVYHVPSWGSKIIEACVDIGDTYEFFSEADCKEHKKKQKSELLEKNKNTIEEIRAFKTYNKSNNNGPSLDD